MGMIEFGALVRSRRESLGLSAEDVSATVGMARSWVSRVENAQLSHPPGPDVMRALSNVLQLPPSELLQAFGYQISEQSPPYDADASLLARHVADWSPKQKKLLWQYILAVESALDANDPPTDDNGDVRATGD